MKPIRNYDAEKAVRHLQMKIGQYIVDAYLARRKETGAKEQTFSVKVYELGGKITIDIDK